ncbi:MAG: hypothetical protein WC301_06545 [Candidatus Omnitrophota bacterium]|jgi:Flp pilus assembly pilin Flp
MLIKAKRITGNLGQNLIEYGLILSIITVALLAMQVYFKRGVQAVVKVAADDFSGYSKHGDLISNIEMAAKQKIYEQDGKTMMSSTSDSTWKQGITNKGDSNIRTEIEGLTITTSDSTWIGGDYRTKGMQDVQEAPASTSN